MKLTDSKEQVFSAGGVVVLSNGDEPQFVLCGKNYPRLWSLPKGTPEPRESIEQTAIREVTEETGLHVEIRGYIDSIQYKIFRYPNHARYLKTVYFYLMLPIGGDVSNHDHEFDEVRWFKANNGLALMSHRNEAEIAKKGISMAE